MHRLRRLVATMPLLAPADECVLSLHARARAGMLAESLGGSAFARAQRQANHARNLRPYLQRLAGWPEAQDAVKLAQGLYLEETA